MGGCYTATDGAGAAGWTEQTVHQNLQVDVVKGEKLRRDTAEEALTSPRVTRKVIAAPRSDGATLPMPQVDRGSCLQGLAEIPRRVRSKRRFPAAGAPAAATGIPGPAPVEEPPLERPSDVPDERRQEIAEEGGGMWKLFVSIVREFVGPGTEATEEGDLRAAKHLSTSVDSYAGEFELGAADSDQEDATPSQESCARPTQGADEVDNERDASTTKASESDETRSQSKLTQETDAVSHDCGFVRVRHSPGSIRVQVLGGEMLEDDLSKALDALSAFLEHPHSQDGFAIQYDLRQVSMPPMSFLARIAEWGNEPSRAERFQTMQTSCSVVLAAGWTFSIARGVLTTFFCCCPPACRTYLISDPDQDVSTAEVYFDPAPAKAAATPGDGAHSEIAHGASVAQVVSEALAVREEEGKKIAPEEQAREMQMELWETFKENLEPNIELSFDYLAPPDRNPWK